MEKLKLMVIGAHPDDPEASCGTACKAAHRGHEVMFLSVTDGCRGHHMLSMEETAARRRQERFAVARLLGIRYETLGVADGEVLDDLALRKKMVNVIRMFSPDIVITHRPFDYHVDHRMTGLLVQDASYMLQVPLFCPAVPAMRHMPVILHMQDRFTQPCPFIPQIAVDVDGETELKLRSLDCHRSQMYEWLPFSEGRDLREIPAADAPEEERLAWLRRRYLPEWEKLDDGVREALRAGYGRAHADGVRVAEAFMLCEYGAQPSLAWLRGALL